MKTTTSYRSRRRKFAKNWSFTSTSPRLTVLESSPTGWETPLSKEELEWSHENDDRSVGEELFQRGLRSSEFPYSLNGIL